MLQFVSKKPLTKSEKEAKTLSLLPEPANINCSAWTVKYEPKLLLEVPVHHSKIKSVKEWINNAIHNVVNGSETGIIHQNEVLAICGNSGCCKSTVVELICKEQHIEIVEWNENMWDPSAKNQYGSNGSFGLNSFNGNNSYSSSNNYNHNSSSWSNGNNSGSKLVNDLFDVERSAYGSQWAKKSETLEYFALQSKYPALGLTQKHPTNNNNNSNNSVGNTFSSHSRFTQTQSQRGETSPQKISTQRTNNFNSSNTQNIQNSNNKCHKILLIHDPPPLNTPNNNNSNTSNAETAQLYDFILSMNCPVILIISSVGGRDDFHHAAERCLPTHVRNRVLFTSMYFPPVTELKTIKVLESIAKKERIPSSRATKEILSELATSCLGDVRHAVVQFQFMTECLQTNSTYNRLSSQQPHSQQQHITHSSSASNILLSSSTQQNTQQNTQNINTNNNKPHIKPKITSGSNKMVVWSSDEEEEEEMDFDSENIKNIKNSSIYGTKSNKNTSNKRSKMNENDVQITMRPELHRAITTGHISSSQSGAARLNDSQLPLNSNSQQFSQFSAGLLDRSFSSTISHSSGGDNGDGSRNSHHPFTSNTSSFSSSSKRDTAYSSLYSVAKVLHAKLNSLGQLDFEPDEVIDRSDLSPDLLLSFLQWNCIESLSSSSRCLMFAQSAGSSRADKYAGTLQDMAVSEDACDLTALEQMKITLDHYSEVDLLIARKYDPSCHMDRDDTFYPDRYISATLSRAAAVGRGVGFREKYDLSKTHGGFKSVFQGMKRPRVIDLRSSTSLLRSKLIDIQTDLIHRHGEIMARGSSSGEENDEVEVIVEGSVAAGSYSNGSGSAGGYHRVTQSQQTTQHTPQTQYYQQQQQQQMQVTQNTQYNTQYNTNQNTQNVAHESNHHNSLPLYMLSDLILLVVPYFRVIFTANSEHNALNNALNGVQNDTQNVHNDVIFSDWIDYKIMTLQQKNSTQKQRNTSNSFTSNRTNNHSTHNNSANNVNSVDVNSEFDFLEGGDDISEE